MPDTVETHAGGSVLSALSKAMVRLHKEQFGRGPTAAKSGWATDDTLVVTLQDALMPAEQALVELGLGANVQQRRMEFQEATRDRFIAAAEEIVGREVESFASALDPRMETVWGVFAFRP
jgi:uncharacterized protein YbcI